MYLHGVICTRPCTRATYRSIQTSHARCGVPCTFHHVTMASLYAFLRQTGSPITSSVTAAPRPADEPAIRESRRRRAPLTLPSPASTPRFLRILGGCEPHGRSKRLDSTEYSTLLISNTAQLCSVWTAQSPHCYFLPHPSPGSPGTPMQAHANVHPSAAMYRHRPQKAAGSSALSCTTATIGSGSGAISLLTPAALPLLPSPSPLHHPTPVARFPRDPPPTSNVIQSSPPRGSRGLPQGSILFPRPRLCTPQVPTIP